MPLRKSGAMAKFFSPSAKIAHSNLYCPYMMILKAIKKHSMRDNELKIGRFGTGLSVEL